MYYSQSCAHLQTHAYWGVESVQNIKKEQLYIQEDHHMFINPTPLIPLPSVSFQGKTFRLMLVKGKMFAGGGGRPRMKKETPSPSRLTLKNGRDSELGEGRLKFLTLKHLDVIN